MNCLVCGSRCKDLFKAKVLNKHDVAYYKCIHCGFIQTETPFWLNEAYSMDTALLDVGLVSRNLHLSDITEKFIQRKLNPAGRFLDYGGGYGLFVRLMRDKGFDYYRHDTSCTNIFAKYFDITDIKEQVKFDLLTAFEVFEHLTDPGGEVEKMFCLSDNILFSTELQPQKEFSGVQDWWYFVPEGGQHISFYTLRSLELLAKKFEAHLFSEGTNVHVLSRTMLSFSFDELNSAPSSLTARIMNKLFGAKKLSAKPRISLIQKDFEYTKKKIST